MVAVVIATYFIVACTIAGLFLFPAGRGVAARLLGRASTQCRQAVSSAVKRQAGSALRVKARMNAALRMMAHRAKQNAWLLAAALLIVIVPVLVAWCLRDRSTLDGFEQTGRNTNTQIAELLRGEQLVPPPALPPQVFTTQEVEQVRPMLIDASRDWALLQPDFAQRLLRVFKMVQERDGYQPVLLEGYRSPERQNKLAALGMQVTNAAAFQSYHQYGLAADIAFLRDGKLVISEKDPWAMEGYRRLGLAAESAGLTWGGRWKLMDFCHVELRRPGILGK